MSLRFAAPALSFTAVAVLAGTPAPAFAANQYRAALAAPASAARLVVRDVVWSCEGAACVAQQTSSRPATDCSALAGHAGQLRSFSVSGRLLTAEELEKCNARAR